jgi:predicted amidohydrolase
VVIRAEGRQDSVWDAAVADAVEVVFFCSAPGLHGRRRDDESWRADLRWWESCGLADAVCHAGRCRLWLGMATQAGAVIDEDFPGLSPLVSPTGAVVERLPDWKPGVLAVDIPARR